MLHFKELNSLSNIMLTTNVEELESSLSKLFNEGNIEYQKTIDDQRRFFYLMTIESILQGSLI